MCEEGGSFITPRVGYTREAMISIRHKSSETGKLGHIWWVAMVAVWLCSFWAEDGSEKPVGASTLTKGSVTSSRHRSASISHPRTLAEMSHTQPSLKLPLEKYFPGTLGEWQEEGQVLLCCFQGIAIFLLRPSDLQSILSDAWFHFVL